MARLLSLATPCPGAAGSMRDGTRGSSPTLPRAGQHDVEQPAAPALSSGSLPLPHLGDCTQEGQPVEALAGGDRVAGRREPGRRPRRGRARRSRRRPGARRTRRPSSAPVSGWWAVETPPMSHRSQVANSGSSPIAACSAACAAPGTSAAASPARSSPAASTVHHTARVRRWRGGRSSGSSPSTSPVIIRRRRNDTTWLVTCDGAERQRDVLPRRVSRSSPRRRSR